jgi:hypothetical protein
MSYKSLERPSSMRLQSILPFITPVLLSRGTCELREALDERRRHYTFREPTWFHRAIPLLWSRFVPSVPRCCQ